MRISDWSSDVCSSDLLRDRGDRPGHAGGAAEVAVEPGDVGIDLGLGRLERGERRAVALDRLAPLFGQALRVELQVRRRGTGTAQPRRFPRGVAGVRADDDLRVSQPHQPEIGHQVAALPTNGITYMALVLTTSTELHPVSDTGHGY